MATALSGLVSTGLSSQSGTGTTGNSTFGGLGQGINITAFVQAAEAGAQANITNVQNQQIGVNQQSAALANITSNLQALQNAAAALQDPLGALASQTATSSNTSDLTATATSIASAGQHTLSITSLATTSSYYSDAVATGDTALGTGDTLNISVGGKTAATVKVDSSNNTLNQIVAAINTQTSAVHASVITDANGSRLALVSGSSGAPGNITVSGTLHGPTGTAINLHQGVQGLNAQLTVDGVPISSASNTLTGVINGVTLNLQGATGDNPVSLSVAPDTNTISSAINSFVSAYNTSINAINAQFQTNSSGAAAPLISDSFLADTQAQLLGLVSYSVTGGSGSTSLATLGISANDDGTLSVDQNQLTAALQSNDSGVQSFFQTVNTGFAAHIGSVLTNLVGGGGELSLDAQGYTAQNNDLTQQISDLQAQLALQTQSLTATYAKVNTTLQELPLLQAQLTQQIASIP